MHTIEKDIKTYLTQTKNFLICDSKLKKIITAEIEQSIYEYAENNGISDIGQIYEHFGTPEETAKTYLSQAEPKKLKKAVSTNKIIITALIIALIMFAVFLIAIFIDAHIDYEGYTVYEEAEEITELLLMRIL